MPRVIQPPGGIPVAPNDTALVQVGFNYGLNYPFVSTTPGSANQIFEFLPQGIAYGLGITSDQVVMHALEPYDTTKDLGYITTLALFNLPSDVVNQMAVELHTPVSKLYQHPNPSVQTLMGMINPSFAVLAGQPLDGTRPTNADPAATTSATANDGGAPLGGDSGMSMPVKTTSVGIGLGVAAGAVVYGAAMVYIARRYKQRKSRHQRASSVPTTEYGYASGGAGAWMSGARGPGRGSGGRDSRNSGNSGSSNGRSVRTQQISAPVMSENSLGWN